MNVSGIVPGSARNSHVGVKSGAIVEQKLLTRMELCVELRISYRACSRMRAEGAGPSGTWLGGRLMFSPKELRPWLKPYTEVPGPQAIIPPNSR